MRRLIFGHFEYSAEQFGLWRIAFGLYLMVYSVKELFYSSDLYIGNAFCLNYEKSYSNSSAFLSSLIRLNDSQVNVLLALCAVLALSFAAGFHRRFSAAGLWILKIWLVQCYNPLSPEIPFVNWLLFACILIPEGEGFALNKKNKSWAMPRVLYWGAWTVVAFALLFAGVFKLRRHKGLWTSGMFMYYFVNTHMYRFAWYGNALKSLPIIFYKLWTWMSLLFEGGAFLFFFSRSTRLLWWMISTAGIILILCLMNFSQILFGMLLVNLFLFDSSWLPTFKNLGLLLASKINRTEA